MFLPVHLHEAGTGLRRGQRPPRNPRRTVPVAVDARIPPSMTSTGGAWTGTQLVPPATGPATAADGSGRRLGRRRLGEGIGVDLVGELGRLGVAGGERVLDRLD